MGVVGRSDLDRLAVLVGEIGQCANVSEFQARVLVLLRDLIACETASYNEVGVAPGGTASLTDPAEHVAVKGVREGFAAYARQNPLVTAGESRGPTALRLSDFITLRDLRRLELYDSVYHPLELSYQLAWSVPTATGVMGVTVNRSRRDFTDRELALLDAAGPFITAAYRNARDRARLQAALHALELVDRREVAIVTVGASGAVEPATASSEQVMSAIAGDPGACADFLGWIEQQRRGSLLGNFPLRLAAGEKRLEARYVHTPAGTDDSIIIRHQPGPTSGPEALRRLGLSRRQSEVLHLVWQGDTNTQIARSLDVSEHTVRHHLEHIYRQLAVSSRTAAAHRANQLLNGDVAT